MKDSNKPVNDIFQNDNGSKNKTKTILLLTIVAIILISVFLIIAWVMTRDNPLQQTQSQNTNEEVFDDSRNRTIPYAHNMELENPFGLNTNKDSLTSAEDTGSMDAPISSVPPLGVPSLDVSVPTMDKQEAKKDSLKHDELENDARFQVALRDLEKQHNEKKNLESKKENDSVKQKEQTPTKVTTPMPPKDTATVKATDSTKFTQNSKDSEKVAPKESQNAANSRQSKEQTPAKPKDSEKVTEKKSNSNIIPKPQNNVVSESQGKSPEQGYYLQVGVFTQTPAQSFLNKIAKYNYRILKTEEDGVTKSKYLIGPYISKNKAKEAEQRVREEVEGKASVIFYERAK